MAGLANRDKLIVLAFAATLLPVFRSGGRSGLTFWSWVWNHTIWGPPIEYIPEEDYKKACDENI